MDARLLDMFHDSADEHLLTIAKRIDVDLAGVVQETVEKNWRIVRHLDRFTHVALQVACVVHDLHRPSAEYVRRADDQRVANFASQVQRVVLGARGAVRRLAQAQFVQQLLEALAIFCSVDHVRAGADDRHAAGLQVACQLERGLSTELNDHSGRFFDRDDLQNILERQWLEIQAIRGIVVGRHGLRIAIDHDRLIAVFAQRERSMHATVVELDPLADPVRATPEHHDFLALARTRFALFFVGRIEIGRIRGEFGSAGVDPLVDRANA